MGKVALFSSDFKRARETAQVMLERLLKEPSIKVFGSDVQLCEALRERGFGKLEGQSNTRYDDVWEEDRKDATHTCFGVESVLSVLERSSAFVAGVESQLAAADADTPVEDWQVILVAHGDVLQILQTG